MAHILTLGGCLEAKRGVLLDSQALIKAFHREEQHGEPSELLMRIPGERRYASLVTVFEFVCNNAREEVRRRLEWLNDRSIKVAPLTKEASRAFQNLRGDTPNCNHLNDLLIAATAISTDLALASADGDFRIMQGVLLVAEFLEPA